MDDLISRQAAIDTLEAKKDKSAKGDIGCFYNTIIQNAIDALNGLPSADVVQVVHGRWMPQKGGGLCCSECGRYALDEPDGNFIHVSVPSKFCPHCGAKMDEGKE